MMDDPENRAMLGRRIGEALRPAETIHAGVRGSLQTESRNNRITAELTHEQP
jgi:hypothetical protein